MSELLTCVHSAEHQFASDGRSPCSVCIQFFRYRVLVGVQEH